jgi:hypothetical protein
VKADGTAVWTRDFAKRDAGTSGAKRRKTSNNLINKRAWEDDAVTMPKKHRDPVRDARTRPTDRADRVYGQRY